MSPYRDNASDGSTPPKYKDWVGAVCTVALFCIYGFGAYSCLKPSAPKPCTEHLVSHRDDRGFVIVDSDDACHPDARLAFVNEGATQWVVCKCGVKP